jgi:hypothetical protein
LPSHSMWLRCSPSSSGTWAKPSRCAEPLVRLIRHSDK